MILISKWRLSPVSKNTPSGGKSTANSIFNKSIKPPTTKWIPHLKKMKAFVFGLIILFATSSFGGELDFKNPPTEIRCSFLSPDKNVVRHHFKIYPLWDKRECDYGITVNNTIVLSAHAFSQDCRDFMRLQINKGSVCMTNEF